MRLFDAGARGDGQPPVVHDRILTVANAITAARLIGLPFFVWLVLSERAYGWAFAVLVVVAATDWLDGYVARRFDQVTRLGVFLDPLIDRMLVATAGVTLLVAGLLPLWVVAAVVVRDVLLFAGALWQRGTPTPPVSRTGKFATANLLVGLPSFLPAAASWAGAAVFTVVAWVATMVGVVAYWVAGVGYARAVASPRRSPDGA